MRKTNNPYIPLDTTELFPYRTNPAFLAVEELHASIFSVIQAQDKDHEDDLDVLQEPLAELSEEIIELSSGGMSLRAWGRRYESAQRLCSRARGAVASLLTAQVISAAQAAKLVAGIDTINNRLDEHWNALQPHEPDHEDEAAAEE
jgi:hypothetical protein